MKPHNSFLKQPKHFWANVRIISQVAGYTAKGTGQIKVPTLAEMKNALEKQGLGTAHILDTNGKATAFGSVLIAYFEHRAKTLNEDVSPK